MLAGVGARRRLPVRRRRHRGLEAAVARSTCGSSSCSASRHGVVALTKVDLVDDESLRARPPRGRRPRRRHVPRRRRIVAVAAPSGRGLDELRAALDRARRDDAAGRRPRTAPAVGRPGLRGQGQRHGRHRHARPAARSSTDDTGRCRSRRPTVRVRAMQTLGAHGRAHRPGHPRSR